MNSIYTFPKELENAISDTVAGQVRARLGLAGRGRGAGFNVRRRQRDDAVHANHSRASLGLTRRSRTSFGQDAVHREPDAEGSIGAQVDGGQVEHAEQGRDEGASAVRHGMHFSLDIFTSSTHE
jgi:hypothetical protein